MSARPSSYHNLTEEQLQTLYTWVDSIPLSRIKKNIARDFADGVLMAEIVAHYFPKLVQLHNYSAASSTRQKKYNWRTLDEKVFGKIHFHVSKQDIEDIVHANPGAIERVLKAFQVKLNVLRQKEERQQSQKKRLTPVKRAGPSNDYANQRKASDSDFGNGQSTDPNLVRIKELQETIEILEAKNNKLNLLLRLKDSKIHAFSAKLKELQSKLQEHGIS